MQIWFNDTARSVVVRYDDVGDSAAWTGLHLATLAHQYNVTQNSTVLVCSHIMHIAKRTCTIMCRKRLTNHWMQFLCYQHVLVNLDIL